jgi:hypothetical protein
MKATAHAVRAYNLIVSSLRQMPLVSHYLETPGALSPEKILVVEGHRCIYLKIRLELAVVNVFFNGPCKQAYMSIEIFIEVRHG